MTLLSVDGFRAELRAKRKPTDGVYRVATEPAAPVADAARTLRFCFSDGSVDRMGDTIAADGWDLSDFVRNPVALWAHDSSAPPIGRASNVGVEGKRLMGDIEFAPPETYSFAETIFRLVEGKFIRAVSVGFLPTKYSFVENDPDRGWGIDFEEQQLLEISLCPIPANPHALAEARAKGIDLKPLTEWAEKLLDGGGKVILPRTELERLRKAAKEPKMAVKTKPRAAGEDDPTSGGDVVGNCGRDKDESCGMKDPSECSIHAGGKGITDDPDADDKAFLRRLRRLLRAADDGNDPNPPDDGDDLPLAHEDAIRMAHKCMRTAKAFQAEAVRHYGKAMDCLDGVKEALDGDADPETDPPADTDPDSSAAKAIRVSRAAARAGFLTAS